MSHNTAESNNDVSKNEKILLDLSWHKLDAFPTSTYEIFKNIQNIYLEGNKVKKLDDGFFLKFSKLRWLDIRNNELIEIPKSVAEHSSLEVLLLEGNQLQQLPRELGSVPNLRGLQLARNPLSYPPKSVLNKGSTAVIQFLQNEWNSKVVNPEIINTSCSLIKNAERKSAEGEEKLRKGNKILKNKNGDSSRQPNTSKKPSGNLRECVKVTQLVKPKPRTALTIFEDWQTKDLSEPNESQSVDGDLVQPTNSETSISLQPSEEINNGRQTQEDKILEDYNALVNSNLLKDIWLRKIREVLEEQESELQRKRNVDVLSKWQQDAKSLQIKKWAEYIKGDVTELEMPFGTDDEYKKMPSRKDINKRDRTSKFKRRRPSKSGEYNSEMVASKINAVLDVLQQLQRARTAQPMTPRTEKRNLATEIKKINELQRTLTSLKALNFNQTVNLH